MMKEESGSGDGFSCNNCSGYCQAGCDSRIHAANRVASRQERLLMCKACERAPAAFLCKADTALLCTACDVDIHSANPLARSHHRVPISRSLYKSPPSGTEDGFVTQKAEEEEEAASWLLNNNKNNQNLNINNGVLFDGEGEEYSNFFEYNSIGDNQFTEQHDQREQQKSYSIVAQKSTYGGDSVVPVQCENFLLGLEYEPSKVYSFNDSISPSVRLSFKLIYFSSSYLYIQQHTEPLFPPEADTDTDRGLTKIRRWGQD